MAKEGATSTNSLSGKRKSIAKSTKSLSDSPPSGNAEKVIPTTPPAPPSRPNLSAVTDEILNSIPKEEIFPLFFAGTTQELFAVRGGTDVTAENPIKIIPKPDILADMFNRAAISDWAPAKQLIQNFPKDEIMLYYDADFKFSQNFFICTTVTAMETILKAAMVVENFVASDTSVTAEAVVKPPRPAFWQTLGSDVEINNERMKNNRELIEHLVYKKQSYFGAPCHFVDTHAEDSFVEMRPFKDDHYDLSKLEISREVQAVPDTTDTASQTLWNRPVNFSSQYENLDLPADVKASLLNSKEIIRLLRHATPKILKALQMSTMMDIFNEDYAYLGDEDFAVEEGTVVHLQEYQSFADIKRTKDRSISCIEWHPAIKGVVAISCSRRYSLDERIDGGYSYKRRQSFIVFWSFTDPIHPQLLLEAPEDINCFQFNHEDPNIVVGGCSNGQVILWNIAEYQERLKSTKAKAGGGGQKNVETPIVKHVALSAIEAGHRSACTDIQWLPKYLELNHNGEVLESGSNGTSQFVTTSLDGTAAFWDLRYKKELAALDLVWRPFYRMPLTAADTTFDYGLAKIAMRYDVPERKTTKPDPNASNNGEDQPAKPVAPTSSKDRSVLSSFYCATEEGDFIIANVLPSEKHTSDEKASRVEHTFSIHFGPMSDVQRSPFFPDILLSVGGWSFAIWKDGVNTGPLLTSPYSSSYVVSGRWSPTRPGVFFITKANGSLEIWDLLDFSHMPTTTQSISSSPLSYLSATPTTVGKTSGSSAQYLAVGDDEGTLHILEIPKPLRRSPKNELSIVRAYFDREVRRLQFAQKRKQVRATDKAKVEAPPAPATDDAAASKPKENLDMAAMEEQAEKEYKNMEKSFLEAAGLLAPAEAA